MEQLSFFVSWILHCFILESEEVKSKTYTQTVCTEYIKDIET